MRQVFIGRGPGVADEDDFERRLYHRCARSSRTRLRDRRPGDRGILSGLDVVPHHRLQGHGAGRAARRPITSTCRTRVSRPRSRSCISASRPTPSRPGASPIPIAWSRITARSTRCAATSTGWRRGRPRVASELFGNDISKLWPISYEGQSDTACFDNALEFLVQGGYSLAHAMMMLIPEAWAGNPLMDEERRAFYEYHAALMEPWDGPAAMAFTDGRQIGATLDRNGLRPARYLVTDDGLVVMASEMGVLPIPEEKIVTKWRLQPGKMLLVDLRAGPHRLRRRDQADAVAARIPIAHWLERTQIVLEDLQAGRAARGAHRRVAARSPAGLRLHAGRPGDPARADGGDRPGSGRLDGHRHADLGAVRSSRSCSTPISSRTSRR